MPNSAIRTIALIVFDGVEILDVTGPGAVFGAANDAAGRACYRLRVVSAQGGAITSSCGVALLTEPLDSLAPAAIDTVLIAGGRRQALLDLIGIDAVRRWTVDACARARRYGSVCTGAFALAAFDLLKGRRVATHWESTALLGQRHPDLEIDHNALYVEDGDVWTSAGVTTGIDMCLALVARDLGDALANTVARQLVLYARRPGYQSQFSPALAAQAKGDRAFAGLVDWMRGHLAEPLGVERLAAQAGMSPRNFHRRFTETMEATPARFVETLRLDHARNLLQSSLVLKEIAAQAGYATPGQFSKAFVRRFGISPGMFRQMHPAVQTSAG